MRSFFFESSALATPRYAGNTAADVDPTRASASLEAIDAVFRDLPTIVSLPRPKKTERRVKDNAGQKLAYVHYKEAAWRFCRRSCLRDTRRAATGGIPGGPGGSTSAVLP